MNLKLKLNTVFRKESTGARQELNKLVTILTPIKYIIEELLLRLSRHLGLLFLNWDKMSKIYKFQ